MKRLFSLFSLGSMLLLAACSAELESHRAAPALVVEGWIENGEAPVVLLSQLMPVGVRVDSFDLWSIPVRFARVSVHDGEQEYILTGGTDARYLLGYRYTTQALRGEVGKEYTLQISFEDHRLSAVTRILPSVALHSVQVRPVAGNDSLCQLSAAIHDPAQERNYYLIRVRQGEQTQKFAPAMGGVFQDRLLVSEQSRIPIYGPVNIKGGAFGRKDDAFFFLPSSHGNPLVQHHRIGLRLLGEIYEFGHQCKQSDLPECAKFGKQCVRRLGNLVRSRHFYGVCQYPR